MTTRQRGRGKGGGGGGLEGAVLHCDVSLTRGLGRVFVSRQSAACLVRRPRRCALKMNAGKGGLLRRQLFSLRAHTHARACWKRCLPLLYLLVLVGHRLGGGSRPKWTPAFHLKRFPRHSSNVLKPGRPFPPHRALLPPVPPPTPGFDRNPVSD